MKKWQSFWFFKFKNLKIDISLQWIFILRFFFRQMVPFLMLSISNNCGFAISSIIKKMAAIVNYVKCWCKKNGEKSSEIMSRWASRSFYDLLFRYDIQDGRHGSHFEFLSKFCPDYFSRTKSSRDMGFSLLASAYLVYVPILKLEANDFKNGRCDVKCKIGVTPNF